MATREQPLVASSRLQRQPRVLIVDDSVPLRALFVAMLKNESYILVEADSAETAWVEIKQAPPDVILLDAIMPGQDGFSMCRQLKVADATRMIPVIILTSLGGFEDRLTGIDAGADDFLTKPVNRVELLTRIRSLLRVKKYADELENIENVVLSLSKAIELRDGYTEYHQERVAERAVALGAKLKLDANMLRGLRLGAVLHDIGKIGVPEAILSKHGPLTPEEFVVMRSHCFLGVQICGHLRSTAMAMALPVIHHHHERFDGSGYPDGLRGGAIPLLARIVAISDAFDAMTSDRPYRNRLPLEQAITILKRGSGSQWDGELVDFFVQLDLQATV